MTEPLHTAAVPQAFHKESLTVEPLPNEILLLSGAFSWNLLDSLRLSCLQWVLITSEILLR